MNQLYKTVGTNEVKNNPAEVFRMTNDGPVVVMNRTTPAVVLVATDEWNRIAARLKMLESVNDARVIEDRNNKNDSWVSGEQMRALMAERGVNVGN